MAKGSKRFRWLKDGIKESRKHHKKEWNRKVRHSEVSERADYKRLAKKTIYDYVS